MNHFFNQTRLAIWPRLVVTVYAAIMIAWLFSASNVVDSRGTPVGTDFITFYSASIASREGQVGQIYNRAYFHGLEQKTAEMPVSWYAWHYPPTFLLFVYPLSFFSYKTALLLWLLFSITPLVFILYKTFPQKNVLPIFFSFPATFQNFLQGQNGFLTAAFLFGGCLLLTEYPFAGGMLLGILSYKPHLFVLVVPALIAGRYWRALAGLAVSLACLTGLTLLCWGPEPWQAFIANIPQAAGILENGAIPLFKMPTPYAALRLAGFSSDFSRVAQFIASLCSLSFVFLLWKSGRSNAQKAAGLIAATLLASPFGFDYDLVILFPAMALLLANIEEKRRACLVAFTFTIWLLPIAGPIIAYLTCFNPAPLLIIALCGLCLAI